MNDYQMILGIYVKALIDYCESRDMGCYNIDRSPLGITFEDKNPQSNVGKIDWVETTSAILKYQDRYDCCICNGDILIVTKEPNLRDRRTYKVNFNVVRGRVDINVIECTSKELDYGKNY